MASFNLTAQLNISGPANLKPVISNIRKQLSSINPNINININTANLGSSSKSLQDLNTNLKNITVSATSAADAMRRFGASVGSVNMSSLPKTMSAATQQSQQLQQQHTRTSQTIKESSDSMADFGRQSALAIRRFAAFTLVTGIIYKFTGALSSASDEFMKFNKQMVQLSQVTGTSIPGLAGLEREITSLSTSLGVSSSSLIDISSTLAQAGLSAQETEQALKALAKSTLAPSFDDLNSTVEGSIALMRQFSISTAELDGALGSINAVAAKFAVEAGDIITAIQRTGGVFAASSKGVSEGTQALNEFIAVFTSIRATTRESAETIATGLRTIFTRIQRRETIDTLKQFGVQLTDLEGKFVGPYEAVKRLSQGLSGLDTRDIRFSSIIEELGGFRQVGKVIPLLQQFATAEKALGVAQRGQGSLTADAAKAQQALAIQMTKVQEEFISLVRKIGSSNEFQTMVKLALNLASAFISVADSAKHALPAITALLAVKGTIGAFRFASGFMGGMRGGGGGRGAGDRMSGAPKGFANGGKIQRFSEGGVPVALEAGEMVFSGPETVKKYGGPTALARFNRTGQRPNNLNRAGGGGVFMVPGSGRGDNFKTTLPEGSFVIKRQSVRAAAANGGRIGYARGGAVDLASFKPYVSYSDTTFDKAAGEDIRQRVTTASGKDKKRLRFNKKDQLEANIRREPITLNLEDGRIPDRLKDQYTKGSPRDRGYAFEDILAKLGYYKKERGSNFSRIDGTRSNNEPVEIRSRNEQTSTRVLLNKLAGAIIGRTTETDRIVASTASQSILNNQPNIIKGGNLTVLEDATKLKSIKTQEEIEANENKKLKSKKPRRKRAALGGLIQRFSEGTDKPLKDMKRAGLLEEAKKLGVNAQSLVSWDDLGNKGDIGNQARAKLIAKLEEQRVLRKTVQTQTSQRAKKTNIAVIGAMADTGVRGSSREVMIPGAKDRKTGKKTRDTPATLHIGALEGKTAARVSAIIRNQTARITQKVMKVIAQEAGMGLPKGIAGRLKKKPIHSGIAGGLLERAILELMGIDAPLGSVDLGAKGLSPELAKVFGIPSAAGVPTDITYGGEGGKTLEEAATRKAVGRSRNSKGQKTSSQIGRALAAIKGSQGKALGGQVQRLSWGSSGGLTNKIAVSDHDMTGAVTKEKETPSLSNFIRPEIAVPDILSGKPTKLIHLLKQYGATQILTARAGGPRGEMKKALGTFYEKNGLLIPQSRITTLGDQINDIPTPERKARALYELVKRYGKGNVHFFDDSEENINAAKDVKGVTARRIKVRKALGGQVQRLAIGGRASRSPGKLVPPQNVGPSPLPTAPSNKLGTGFYDLLDKSGLPKWKYPEIENFVKTNKLSPPETRQYIEKIKKEQSSKLGMRTNVSQLAASLQEPDFKPSTLKQIELGRRLAIGGNVERQRLANAGGPLRNRKRITGLLDVDKLRDSERAREAMQKLGFYNPKKDTYDVSGYRDSLANAALAERQKKNGAVDYMAADLGSPGAGKSTFGLKGKGSKRYIETIEDLQKMIASGNRVSIRNAMASLDEDKIRHLSQYDRIRVLSSTTPEEMKELKARLKNRTRQGKESIAATGVDTSTQFNRRHTIKAQSSEDTEAMLRFKDENGKQIIDESKIATYSISTGKRKKAHEVPMVRHEALNVIKGGFGPTTREGHVEGLFKKAKKDKKLLINVGPDESLTDEDLQEILSGSGKAHGARTVIFDRKTRKKMVEKSVKDENLDAYVSTSGDGFGLADMFKVGKDPKTGQSIYTQPDKKKSTIVIGEDRAGSEQKYRDMGYDNVQIVPRGEGAASASKVRDDMFEKRDFSGVTPSVRKMLEEASQRGVFENTLNTLPKVVQHVQKKAQAKIASIDLDLDKLLTSVPGGRLTEAFTKQNPELAKEIKRLRAKKSDIKGSAKRSDIHSAMRNLKHRYPEKYGFMDDEEESSFKPQRPFTGKRFQPVAIGGVIQRFARGTSSPISAPGEIPIMAQEGEFVLNKHATGQIGEHTLAKLNRGGKVATDALDSLPKYHTGGMVQKLAGGTSKPLSSSGGDVVLQKAASDLGLGRLAKTILGIENILGKVSPRLQQSFGKLIIGLNNAGSSMDSLGAKSRAIVDKNNQTNKRGPIASSVVAEAALSFGEKRSLNVPFSGAGRYQETKEAATANYVNRAESGIPNKTGPNPHYENRTWDTKSHTTSSGEKFVPYNKSQPVEGASKNLATNLYQGVKPKIIESLQANNRTKAPTGSLEASHEVASNIVQTHNEAFEKSKNELGVRNITDKKEKSKAISKAKKQANQAVRDKLGVAISNTDLSDLIGGSHKIVQNQKDLDERARLGRVATAKDRVENKVKPQTPKGYNRGMKYYAKQAKETNAYFGLKDPASKSTVLSQAQNYVEERNKGATQRGYADYGAYLEDKAKKTKSHTKLADIRKKQERFTASNAIIQREQQKKEQGKTERVIPQQASQREAEFFNRRGSQVGAVDGAGLARSNKRKAASIKAIKTEKEYIQKAGGPLPTGQFSYGGSSGQSTVANATSVSRQLAEKREAYFQKTGKRLPGYVETGPAPSAPKPMSEKGRNIVERKAAPGLFNGDLRIEGVEAKDVGGLTVEEHTEMQRSSRRQRKSLKKDKKGKVLRKEVVGADRTQRSKDALIEAQREPQRIIESNAQTNVASQNTAKEQAAQQSRLKEQIRIKNNASQRQSRRQQSRPSFLRRVSSGFGIGGMAGSAIPGVGTALGAAVGSVAGALAPTMTTYGNINARAGRQKINSLSFSNQSKALGSGGNKSLGGAILTQAVGNLQKSLGLASASVGHFATSFGKVNFSGMFSSLGGGFTGLISNLVGLQRTVIATQGKLAGMTKGQAQAALKSGRITKKEYDGAFGRGSKSKAVYHSAKDQIPEMNSDFERREKTAAGKARKQALIDDGFGKGGAGTADIRKGGSGAILARAKLNRTMEKLDNGPGGGGPSGPFGPTGGGPFGPMGGGPGGPGGPGGGGPGGPGGGGPGGPRSRRARSRGGKAAAPVAPNNGGGGGGGGGMGGMGMYMGEMAMSMAGSAAVEQAAKNAGGEKTLEGKLTSHIGGSVATGASTGMMMGSMIGGAIGTAIPIPVVGTVSGAVAGGVIGTAAGAIGGGLYGMATKDSIVDEHKSEQRTAKIEKARERLNTNLGTMQNASLSGKTREEARNRTMAEFSNMSSLGEEEQKAGLKKKRSTGAFLSGYGWLHSGQGSLSDRIGQSTKLVTGGMLGWESKESQYTGQSAKTDKERAEAAKPMAESAKDVLAAEIQRTGKGLKELESSMPKGEFDKLSRSIALSDHGYQAMESTTQEQIAKINASNMTEEQKKERIQGLNSTLDRQRQMAVERETIELKHVEELEKTARANAALTQAMQKVTTSFERMASAMTAAAARADKVMENGKLGIEAVDNPMAAVQQGQISKSADILSNPEAYSMNEMEGALRQHASMAGPNSEAMVQSAMMPRKLEQSLGTAMQEAKAGGKDDPGTRDAVKKAVLGTVSQAFGGNLPEQMKKNIDDFVTNFKGDIRQLDFNDIIKAIPEFANNITASKEVLAAFQAQAASATRAIGMIGDAAQKSAAKGQEIRNRDADTYSTVANSTLAFKRATGEKISYQADASVRNQARATRLGTSAQVAASPKAMLDRYNQLNKATGTAATAQQQITEANRPALESGDQNQSDGAIKAMANAARTTAEFAQATQQARDEIMNLPNDIKENIGGIMQELQDVMQERAAKIGAAGGLMEKILTSTPKDLRKMGNTFNNLNQTLAGKGVSFEESHSANTAYNQVRKQGGSHAQAQRSAQEAYAQESGDTLSMAKELAPLLGAVDPEAQNKMMGSVYESMFAARGQDTSKMMVGDKSMKDYIEMMKAGGKKDPKVEALQNALAAQQGALQAANDAAKELIAQEAEALTTKTGAAVLDAMLQGAEAVRVAVAEGKQIGITPPGEVGKPGAPQGKAPLGKEEIGARKAENEGKIAEAQKTLNSGTASADDAEEARRTILAAEQENAVLSGNGKNRKNLSASASTMNYKDHQLEGETEEEFNTRKQKLQEMVEGTQPPATTPPQPKQATGAQAAANGQQAAAPAPATGQPTPNTTQQAAGAPPMTPADQVRAAIASGDPAAISAATQNYVRQGITPPQATGAQAAANGQQAAIPAPPTNAVEETEQSKKNFEAERASAKQETKAATEAATVGAKPVSAPQQPQKVMSLKELKAQRSEDSKRLALKGAIGDYRKQAEADPERKTLDKTGAMTNKEFLADKEQQLSGMQDKFDEKNPELAAKRKKNAEDSQRRAKNGKKNGEEQQPTIPAEAVPLPEEAPLTEEEIGFFNPGYKAPAATSQQPPQATGAQASANGQQASSPVPQTTSPTPPAPGTQAPTSAANATGAQSTSTGQQASAPVSQTNAPTAPATGQPQRQGPMSYSDIRDQKRKQYEQSRYQKQQQYLSGFNEETREKMKQKLGSRLLENPNPTPVAAQNNQPGTAPSSTPRGSSSAPPASAPMGSPVAAPRTPQTQASQQNQGGGVLNFESFANKLDTLLTKLAEVHIPNEIKLTSGQLGVTVTLNGGEVMATLDSKIREAVLAQAVEQLRNYDSGVTGGEGATQGSRPMGGGRQVG